VPTSVYVGFVVDSVALGQVFLQVLRFYPLQIIPALLHSYSYIILGTYKGPLRDIASLIATVTGTTLLAYVCIVESIAKSGLSCTLQLTDCVCLFTLVRLLSGFVMAGHTVLSFTARRLIVGCDLIVSVRKPRY
jgi:hypothetical protein